MKLLFTFIIGFLCIIAPSYAQKNANISELFATNTFSTESNNDLLFICRMSNKETAEQKEWKSGVLIDYDNKAHRVKGHYDIASDEMQILLQNQSKIILPQKIKAIKVGEMIFVPCEFEGQESLTYGYFQVLSSNKIDLLKRFESNNGEIVKSFYARKKEEAAKPIKLNKSCLLKYLDDSRTKKFLKNRNLNIKQEQDLIALFNYYNEIK